MVEGDMRLRKDSRIHFRNIKEANRARLEKPVRFLYVLTQNK
jgi:ribosome biogenesis protein Nip4